MQLKNTVNRKGDAMTDKWEELRQRIAAGADKPLTDEQLRSGILNERDAEKFWNRAIADNSVLVWRCMRCGTGRRGLLHFCWARRLWQRIIGRPRGSVSMYPDPRR